MKRIHVVLALVGVLSTAGARVASATVVQRASLEALVKSSAVIVHGVVRAVDEASPKASAPFRTMVDIDITEPVKGLAAGTSSLQLELPGGRSGGFAMYVPGMPRFVAGDEVGLLLEATSAGFVPAGLAQGVFHVERATGAAVVRRQLEGATYADILGRPVTGPPEPTRLDDLLTTLRALTRAGSTP